MANLRNLQNDKSSQVLTNIVEMSFECALKLEQTTIITEHVLYAILSLSVIQNFLSNKGIDIGSLRKELLDYLQSQTPYLKYSVPIDIPEHTRGVITLTIISLFERVLKNVNKNKTINIIDILKEIIKDTNSYASYYMRKFQIGDEILEEMENKLTPSSTRLNNSSSSNMDNSSDGYSDGALDEFCVNLNEKMKMEDSDSLIGRTKELFSIAHTLVKRKKCNVLLVGEPGVGKSAIVEGLAKQINEKNVQASLQDKTIYSLEIGNVLAGCRFRGDFEEKLHSILEDLTTKKNAILFVDEAEHIGAGEGGNNSGMGFSGIFKPELSRGSIKMIAATTLEGYRKSFEKDTALMRRFRVIFVDEPSLEDTKKILMSAKDGMENFHNVRIEESAIDSAIQLTVKYQSDRKLPDKAIDIIDSACARQKLSGQPNLFINDKNIIQEVTDLTGIIIKSEEEFESEKKNNFVLDLKNRLNQKVYQQEKAVDTIYRSMITASAGLRDPNRPIGSFLFVGPSGVGKTMLAKSLADEMNMKFIRYDMSEFMEKHSVSRLIGSSPGYVGYGDGGVGEGQLINDIIKNRNGVFLMDEVEKAHPNIFNIFLQILDNGIVTGGNGKVADARNCIFIMSSNLGTKDADKKNLGFVEASGGASKSSSAVNNFFLTELRGRMSGIIEFNKLNENTYRKIVMDKITNLSNDISSRNIKFIPSDDLVNHILSLNKTNKYGARQIAKLVEEVISFPVGLAILSSSIKNGSTVHLDWKNGELKIDSLEVPAILSRKIRKRVVKNISQMEEVN